MARIQTLTKDLVAVTAGLTGAALNAELARFARAELQNHIHSGEASSRYDKWVNGRAGADESTVVAPGPIVYEFHWWNEVIDYSLEVLRKRSPVRSGRFRDSWAPWVNGSVATDYAAIPIGAEVYLVNNQPYARKIEVGFMTMSVPHGVAKDATVMIKGRFGNLVDMRQTMIALPNGYILKGVFRKGVRPNSRDKLRRDTMAGAQMTYPAIKMTMRA